MNFAFVGDTHGNLKLMYQTILDWQVEHDAQIDYIFQVGDLGFWPTYEDMDPSARSYGERHEMTIAETVGDYPSLALKGWEVPIPTYFIRGNHENQPLLLTYEKVLIKQHPTDYHRRAIEILPNFHYLPDGHVIELQGQRIGGWGGCWSWKTFDMGYWSKTRMQLHSKKKKYGNKPWPKRTEHMTKDRGEWLLGKNIDILLTHDAPTGCGLTGGDASECDPETLTMDQPEGMGTRKIRELIERTQPKFHFCGHWHQFREQNIGQTYSIVLNQVSPGIPTKDSFRVLRLD